MIEPFADEEAVIVDDMCKKCGGRIDNSDVCEDCGCNCSGASAAWEILNGRQVKRASCKSLVLDDSDNQFNSMQS